MTPEKVTKFYGRLFWLIVALFISVAFIIGGWRIVAAGWFLLWANNMVVSKQNQKEKE